MVKKEKYIYSILPCRSSDEIGAKAGIKDSEEKEYGNIGFNNQEVRMVCYRDIAAVVSDATVKSFNGLSKEELTNYIAIHQKVNEEIMQNWDIVPMAFGMIAPGIKEVKNVLEKAYIQFKAALKKIEGKAEFVVQGWWDKNKFLQKLVETNAEIQKLQQEASLKKGIFGMPVKLKLGQMIHREVETRRKIYIENVQRFLGSLSDDCTLNRLSEDDMIVNFSFLIKKNKELELDEKMEKLGKKYEGELRFKYIGPMPPYSFTNITLSLGNFEIINQARKLLRLRKEATFDEIRNNYYALARQYHPDKYPDNPAAVQEQMKKIITAHNILETYCRSCDERAGKIADKKYSFRNKDVENSLIIKKEQEWSDLS